MRRAVHGAVLASLVSAGTMRAETIAGSAFQVGLWNGIGTRDPARGLVMCQVSLLGARGERIDVSLWSDNRLAILMAPTGAGFQDAQQYDLSIWTDNQAAIAVPAVAMGEKILIVEFTDIDEAIQGAQTCLQTHSAATAPTAPKDGDEHEIEGSRFTIGDTWWGGATALADGRFDYCGVSIEYSGTTTVSYVLRSDDKFVMIAAIEGASFPTGEVIEAILMGETFGPDPVRARVVNPTMIAIPIPGIKSVAAIIRQNGRISIEVAGRQPDVFRTPDASAAVDAALACYTTYSAPG